jgi:PAS domain S-box-containing protein
MGRDITAQRKAEMALRQSERRLSGLIRQAPVGVFETDVRGRLVFANERMQRLSGRTLESLSGVRWIDSIVREDREAFLAVWNDALTNKREVDLELRIMNARGKSQWVSVRIRPMTDAANRFSGYLGVVGDISERKKAESMRSDVESVVRHDLKSPLGSMQNAMELLELLGPLNAEQTQVVAEVRTLTRRMQDLITLSIDLHAMEAGVFKPQVEPVDLCAVVEMQRTELRPLVDGKGLRLSIVSDCPGGTFYVQGERRLLDAVFSNLLKNAAEASPEGDEITVRLVQEGPLAEVFVRNHGEVPKSIRDRFFEKYATAGKSGGTGLGTYSARLMVRTMGGTLSLNTEEPGATTLILRLPMAQPETAASSATLLK